MKAKRSKVDQTFQAMGQMMSNFSVSLADGERGCSETNTKTFTSPNQVRSRGEPMGSFVLQISNLIAHNSPGLELKILDAETKRYTTRT